LIALLGAAGPATYVVPNFSALNVSEKTAAFFTTHLAQQLRKRGVKVITQDEIATTLGAERQRELLGCNAEGTGCLVELANALGSSGVVRGAVAKLGDLLQLSVTVLGRDAAALAEFSGGAGSEKKLLEVLDQAAAELADQLKYPPEVPLPGPAAVSTSRPLRPRAWVPAATGAALTGVAVALLVMARGDYDRLKRDRFAPGEGEGLARRGSTSQLAGYVGLGVGVAAMATGVVLYLREPRMVPMVLVSPDGASLGVSGVWP
jgi:hypothetical protein